MKDGKREGFFLYTNSIPFSKLRKMKRVLHIYVKVSVAAGAKCIIYQTRDMKNDSE